MTRADVLRLAREAGLCTWIKVPEEESEKLERFVALVAAAEREACAKVCESERDALNENLQENPMLTPCDEFISDWWFAEYRLVWSSQHRRLVWWCNQ